MKSVSLRCARHQIRRTCVLWSPKSPIPPVLIFRKNIVYNFKDRYCDYLRSRLRELAQVPIGWPTPNNDRFDEFIQDIVDSVRDRIQRADTPRMTAAGTPTPGQRFDYIADGTVRDQVVRFITRMVHRYRNSAKPFDGAKCRLEVENNATVPSGWPRNKTKLVAALFQRILGMSLEPSEAGADQEDQGEGDLEEQEQEGQESSDVLAGLARNNRLKTLSTPSIILK